MQFVNVGMLECCKQRQTFSIQINATNFNCRSILTSIDVIVLIVCFIHV